MRPPPDTRDGRGALVLGGDYRALGVVRSLGRRGIPVWVVRSADDHMLAATSRFCRRGLVWPNGEAVRLAFLRDLGERHGLAGWTVFPTADATAAFVARHHAELAGSFRLTTPPWPRYVLAYDKRLTHRLAEALGVPRPAAFIPDSRADLARYPGPFPAVLKPATKPRLNQPPDKAWLVRDHGELLSRYDAVAPLIDPGAVLVQELIPGVGGQLSVAAVCHGRVPLLSMVAARVRQYPADFGRSSTYVETIDDPGVAALGRRILTALQFDGPVEIEFKRDPRDGRCKLLDINARVWGWHTIGTASGVDVSYTAWLLANGEPPHPVAVRAGLRWLRLTTDAPAAYREWRQRRLTPGTYLRALLTRHERPVAALDDPVPGLVEMPLYLLSRHLLGRAGDRPGARGQYRPSTASAGSAGPT